MGEIPENQATLQYLVHNMLHAMSKLESSVFFPTLPGPPGGHSVTVTVLRESESSLVGRTLLYWWPARNSRTPLPARRLLARGRRAYTLQTSALRGTADTLLDAASYGHRWVLLSPAPAAGVDRAAVSSPIRRQPDAPRPPGYNAERPKNE